MKKINNKGFTLIEVLAVIVIIAIIGLIAVPSVLSIINTGKNSSYDILVKDITVAAIGLHEEVSFMGNELYKYNNDGKTGDLIAISSNKIITNLQTLVSNGFLNGTNNPNKTGSGSKINEKIITNPKTKEDMGSCEIIITKTVDANTFETSYTIEPKRGSSLFCPTKDEYENALKGS